MEEGGTVERRDGMEKGGREWGVRKNSLESWNNSEGMHIYFWGGQGVVQFWG